MFSSSQDRHNWIAFPCSFFHSPNFWQKIQDITATTNSADLLGSLEDLIPGFIPSLTSSYTFHPADLTKFSLGWVSWFLDFLH